MTILSNMNNADRNDANMPTTVAGRTETVDGPDGRTTTDLPRACGGVRIAGESAENGRGKKTQPDLNLAYASCCGPTQTSTRFSTSDPRQRSLAARARNEGRRTQARTTRGESTRPHTVETGRDSGSARSTPGTYKNSTRAPRHERRAPRDRIQTTVTVLDTVLGSCPCGQSRTLYTSRLRRRASLAPLLRAARSHAGTNMQTVDQTGAIDAQACPRGVRPSSPFGWIPRSEMGS